MRQKITSGETAFCTPESCLWDMRQAAKAALLNDAPKQKFVVTYEEHYYGNILEQLLSDPQQCVENALILGDKIVGEQDGAWKCAALWSLSSWTGVLLHRHGEQLLYAYIPLLKKETAEREHELAMALGRLAKAAQDTPILLERPIAFGRHQLSDILETLSEGLEV